jgi:hypothetical protein
VIGRGFKLILKALEISVNLITAGDLYGVSVPLSDSPTWFSMLLRT